MPNAKNRKRQKAKKLAATTQDLPLPSTPVAAPIRRINMSTLDVIVHGTRVLNVNNDGVVTVYDCGEVLSYTSTHVWAHDLRLQVGPWSYTKSPIDSHFIVYNNQQAYIYDSYDGQRPLPVLPDVCRDILDLKCFTLRNPSSLVGLNQDWSLREYDLGPDAKFENAKLVSTRNFFSENNDDKDVDAKSMSRTSFARLTGWDGMPPVPTSIHCPTQNQVVVTTQSDMAIKRFNVDSANLKWHSYVVVRPVTDQGRWPNNRVRITAPCNVNVVTVKDKKNDFVTCVTYRPNTRETAVGTQQEVQRHRFSLWHDQKKTKTTGVVITPALDTSKCKVPSSVMRQERLFALPNHESLVFLQDLKDVKNSLSQTSAHLIDAKDLKNYPLKIDQLQDIHGVLSDGRLICSDIYGDLFVLDFANISLDRQHLKTVESKDAKVSQTAHVLIVRADENLIFARDNYLLRAMYNISLPIDLGRIILSYAPGKIFLASTSRNTLFKTISDNVKDEPKPHQRSLTAAASTASTVSEEKKYRG